MSARDIPIIPTVLVVAAALTMVALGIWQLGRAEEKAAMIEAYSALPPQREPVPLIARGSDWTSDYLYRRVSLSCEGGSDMRSTAGSNPRGAKGWVHIARCAVPGSDAIEVALGWSRDPEAPSWNGGEVTGILGPNQKVTADPALAGLERAAPPNPGDLPNNHLAYAGQWFFFALTALVIYGFALRARSRKASR